VSPQREAPQGQDGGYGGKMTWPPELRVKLWGQCQTRSDNNEDVALWLAKELKIFHGSYLTFYLFT
jgi:hypothetical protein